MYTDNCDVTEKFEWKLLCVCVCVGGGGGGDAVEVSLERINGSTYVSFIPKEWSFAPFTGVPQTMNTDFHVMYQ